MNRFAHIALLPLLALSLAFAGCDSDSDDGGLTIEERLLGMWEVSEASVRVSTLLGTIPVPVLDASDSEAVSISFMSGSRFAFTLTGPVEAEVAGQNFVILEAGQSTTNSGTFEVVENGEQIRFTTTEIDGQTVPVPGSAEATFELRSGDNTLALIADNTPEGQEIIAFLFGDALPEELLNTIEGGEATFSRAN